MSIPTNNVQAWMRYPNEIASNVASYCQWFSFFPIVPYTDPVWFGLSTAVTTWMENAFLPLVHTDKPLPDHPGGIIFYGPGLALSQVWSSGSPFFTDTILGVGQGLCVRRTLLGATGFQTNRVHVPGVPMSWQNEGVLTEPAFDYVMAALPSWRASFTLGTMKFSPHIISYVGVGHRLNIGQVFCNQKLFTLYRRTKARPHNPNVNVNPKPPPP